MHLTKLFSKHISKPKEKQSLNANSLYRTISPLHTIENCFKQGIELPHAYTKMPTYSIILFSFCKERTF